MLEWTLSHSPSCWRMEEDLGSPQMQLAQRKCELHSTYVIQKLDYFIIANSNDRETAICCIIVSHPMPAQHFRTTLSGHYRIQLVF